MCVFFSFYSSINLRVKIPGPKKVINILFTKLYLSQYKYEDLRAYSNTSARERRRSIYSKQLLNCWC